VLRLWRETLSSRAFATDHIARAFRADRRIGSHERRSISEALYGMLRQMRRLDYALRLAGFSPRSNDEADQAMFLAWLVLHGRMDPAAAAQVMPGVRWDAVAGVDQAIARDPDPVERFALAHSLPDWLARRLLARFGDEAEPLAGALNLRAPLTVRANLLKTSRDDLAARLAAEGVTARPTRFAPHGLVFESHVNAFGLKAFRDGLFEVQDEGSQLVAALVASPPGGRVVDACAGAGGKTLAIAADMGNRGRLLSLDVSARKLAELARRARRAGLSNWQAIQVEPDAYPDAVRALEGSMDRVLADVPCSGIGAMRRNPDARWRLTEAEADRLPARQAAIALTASSLLKPGGRLIYATCTILPHENQQVVERILEQAPHLSLVRVAEIWGSARAAEVCDASGTFLELLPHRHDTDGFFAAVLRPNPRN
jgi:16S rRNA (cytosine967-C5)-methyltransferase